MRHKYKIIMIVVVVPIILVLLLIPVFATCRNISPQVIEYAINPSIQGIERKLLVDATAHATAMWEEQNPELSFVMTDKRDVLQITTPIPEIFFPASLFAHHKVNGFVACPIWDVDTTNCTLYIESYLISKTTVDLEPEYRINIVAHELGHVLGLHHYPDSRENHLMGADALLSLGAPYDTKGYVIPERLLEP